MFTQSAANIFTSMCTTHFTGPNYWKILWQLRRQVWLVNFLHSNQQTTKFCFPCISHDLIFVLWVLACSIQGFNDCFCLVSFLFRTTNVGSQILRPLFIAKIIPPQVTACSSYTLYYTFVPFVQYYLPVALSCDFCFCVVCNTARHPHDIDNSSIVHTPY